MVSHISVALVIKNYPVGLAERNRTITIIRAQEKDVKVVVNVYTKKKWNKTIQTDLSGSLFLTW